MTTSWLEGVMSELTDLEIDNLIEPNADIGPKDHIVGEASDELKKIFGLAMDLERTANELQTKAKVLMDIFWVSLKEEFDLWSRESVGIRRGWKVVWNEPELPPNIMGIINDIFGK